MDKVTCKKTVSTRAWIIILLFLFAASAAAAAILGHAGNNRKCAYIYMDDALVCEIDLNSVAEPYEFTVECADGYNIISVRGGGICVSSADCSDGTCVKQGWLEGGFTPIVCLPHGLVIQLEDSAAAETENGIEIDAAAG